MSYPGEDLVYFIYAPVFDAVKIGVSRDPDERVRSLQTAIPVSITLLHWIHGGFVAEKRLHRQFQHLRLRGEWFRAEPELLAFIDNLRDRPRRFGRISAPRDRDRPKRGTT